MKRRIAVLATFGILVCPPGHAQQKYSWDLTTMPTQGLQPNAQGDSSPLQHYRTVSLEDGRDRHFAYSGARRVLIAAYCSDDDSTQKSVVVETPTSPFIRVCSAESARRGDDSNTAGTMVLTEVEAQDFEVRTERGYTKADIYFYR